MQPSPFAALLKPFAFPTSLVVFMAILHALGMFGLIGNGESWANTPRNVWQPWGILSFHLRHANWAHWVANAVPLILLAGLSHLMVPRATVRAWILLPVLSGILLWIWGRPGHHIGASALTYGWFYFLLAIALLRRDRATIAAMMVALLLFGSMVWAFMAPAGVSWEGHVAGALAGVVSAFIWRRLDPLPKPIFEDEEDEENLLDDLSLYATRRPKNSWDD